MKLTDFIIYEDNKMSPFFQKLAKFKNETVEQTRTKTKKLLAFSDNLSNAFANDVSNSDNTKMNLALIFCQFGQMFSSDKAEQCEYSENICRDRLSDYYEISHYIPGVENLILATYETDLLKLSDYKEVFVNLIKKLEDASNVSFSLKNRNLTAKVMNPYNKKAINVEDVSKTLDFLGTKLGLSDQLFVDGKKIESKPAEAERQ